MTKVLLLQNTVAFIVAVSLSGCWWPWDSETAPPTEEITLQWAGRAIVHSPEPLNRDQYLHFFLLETIYKFAKDEKIKN